MGANSKIEWCHHTFNPWIGCTKVSPGCAHCYAEKSTRARVLRSEGHETWGKGAVRSLTSASYWKQPLKWDRDAGGTIGVCPVCKYTFECDADEERRDNRIPCKRAGCQGLLIQHRSRVFCASLADVFEDWSGPLVNSDGAELFRCPCGSWRRYFGSCPSCGRIPHGGRLSVEYGRRRLFSLIDDTPYLDWIIVTNRPENIRQMWQPIAGRCEIRSAGGELENCQGHYRANVWLLTSVEDQEQADKRIPELLKCRDLSPVLGLSMEPLLGPVDLMEIEETTPEGKRWWSAMETGTPEGATLDWVIVGGEPGANARPMHPDWARSLRDQCAEAGVPYFFKQWGEWLPTADLPVSAASDR